MITLKQKQLKEIYLTEIKNLKIILYKKIGELEKIDNPKIFNQIIQITKDIQSAKKKVEKIDPKTYKPNK